jgi:hypothetical protein
VRNGDTPLGEEVLVIGSKIHRVVEIDEECSNAVLIHRNYNDSLDFTHS